MGRALKYLLRLAVLALVALVVYALVADLPPPTRTVEVDLPVPAAKEGAGQAAPESTPDATPDAPDAQPEAPSETSPGEEQPE